MNNRLDHEINRKLIHLSSLIYPILYLIIESRIKMSFAVGAILILLSIVDFFKYKSAAFGKFFYKKLKFTLRDREKTGVSGATFFMLGTFITILLFPKNIAILSLFILIICDSFASIVGIKFGKIKIINTKTLEGSASFLLSAVIISYFGSIFFNISLTALLIASLAASLLEVFDKSLKCDDNVLIPIGYAIIVFLLV
jgi:dolichol kinase